VKLLFDQNLAPNLVKRLADIFPGSTHVFLIGLDCEDDRIVRRYALTNDFVIVTKDSDYSDLSTLLGYPPKVIWIRRGNCSTVTIEFLLRSHASEIAALQNDLQLGILTIY
jgi:predicted nuclease of predicted toxin-antitoxin system